MSSIHELRVWFQHKMTQCNFFQSSESSSWVFLPLGQGLDRHRIPLHAVDMTFFVSQLLLRMLHSECRLEGRICIDDVCRESSPVTKFVYHELISTEYIGERLGLLLHVLL
ncbi:hypothetical protein Tco_0971524 [Tanacetum coccineum]